MVVLKEGNKPTFQSENYGSILDSTLASEDIKRNIHSWMVRDDEFLSDHCYMTFEYVSGKKLKTENREKQSH